MYCLDSNVIIQIFREDLKIDPKLKEIIEEDIVCTNPIILSELFAGCYSSKYENAQTLVQGYIDDTKFLEFDITSCQIYGQLWQILTKKGKTTQDKDLMIAAICIAHNAILVTSNKKHFEHIPGLKAEYV